MKRESTMAEPRSDVSRTRAEGAPRLIDDVGAYVRAELARICDALAATLAGRVPPSIGDAATLMHPAQLVQSLGQTWWYGAPPVRSSCGARAALERRADALEHQGHRVPLRDLCRRFNLCAVEFDALLLALAVEVDGRVSRALSILDGRDRPTLGLALELAGEADIALTSTMLTHPVFADGLLRLEGDGPLPMRMLRLDPDVVRRITAAEASPPNHPGLVVHPLRHPHFDRLVIDDEVRRRFETWSLAAGRPAPGKASTAPILILVGASGSGRRTLAYAYAALAGYGLAALGLEPAEPVPEPLTIGRREARWHDAALFVELPPGMDHQRCRELWHATRGWSAPLIISVAPTDAGALLDGAPPVVTTLAIPPPTLAQRSALWRALLPPALLIADEDVCTLAARFHFGPGLISKCIERASVAAGPATSPTAPLLCRTARELGSERMGELAQRLPTPFTRDTLIVSPLTHAELNLALAWVKRSHQVMETWGLGERVAMGRGLTALFAGPPGTGKTMAAQVLARELDVELFRVDLSRVMSKYIGETERNLGQLFDQAHASGAALFFDEADALFGARSETHSAHDRYANIEIGYLLQRMEEHEGISILATNRMGDMDEAFLRRFHIIARFDMPDACERLRIWEGMLPPALNHEPLPLKRIAENFELSGGEIRNAVLAAAFLAADEGHGMAPRHLANAVGRVLAAAGRVVDPRAMNAAFEP